MSTFRTPSRPHPRLSSGSSEENSTDADRDKHRAATEDSDEGDIDRALESQKEAARLPTQQRPGYIDIDELLDDMDKSLDNEEKARRRRLREMARQEHKAREQRRINMTEEELQADILKCGPCQRTLTSIRVTLSPTIAETVVLTDDDRCCYHSTSHYGNYPHIAGRDVEKEVSGDETEDVETPPDGRKRRLDNDSSDHEEVSGPPAQRRRFDDSVSESSESEESQPLPPSQVQQQHQVEHNEGDSSKDSVQGQEEEGDEDDEESEESEAEQEGDDEEGEDEGSEEDEHADEHHQ